MKEKPMTDNYTISNLNVANLGYHCLYNIMMQSELPEGSIVVAVLNKKDRYIFQTLDMVDVMDDEVVYVTNGTLAMFTTEGLMLSDREIDAFYIKNLRFPTEEELKQYMKLDTV